MKPNGIYFTNTYTTGSIAKRFQTMQMLRNRIYSAIINEYDVALNRNSAQIGSVTEEAIPI